ncbi:MAG: hypothetical protein ABW199_00230 [Caulobacterales bacterium]
MKQPEKKTKPPRGPVGVFFMLGLLACGAGLALDFLSPHHGAAFFDRPGAPALIGAGVAIAAAIIAHALRFILGRVSEDAGDRA